MWPRIFACYWLISLFQISLSQSDTCIFNDEPCICSDLYYAKEKLVFIGLRCSEASNTTEIPSDQLRRLANNSQSFYNIILTHKQYRVVRSYAFQNLSVVELDLSRNQIEEIQPNAFAGLFGCTTLVLEYNYIKTLHHGSFFDLSSLTALDLSGQMLTGLETGVFVGLDTLTGLYLKLNQIHQLHQGSLLGLNMVEDFNMAFNNLEVIGSNSFLNMTRLFDLDLKQYGINKLEPRAFNGLMNLKSLDLSVNFLTRLVNDTFVGLDSLVWLNLSDNNLHTIETNAFDGLINLVDLDLSDNYLEIIDGHVFSSLSKLQSLVLKSNTLKSFEEYALDGLGSSLVQLDLSDNRMDKISKHYFADMSSLQTLNLASNLLSSIDDHSFDDMTSLKYLYLNDNCLFRLSKSLFANLKSLEVLDLNQNTLVRFSADTATGLIRLKELRFSPNYLTAFWTENTESLWLKELTTLDLSASFFLESFELSDNLISLRLDNSQKTKLLTNKSSNSSLTQLSYLYLRNFGKINQVNFRLLSNLVELDLSLNQISDLSYFFENKKYTSLKSLFLRGSRFNFSLGLFTNFPSLTKLDIGSAQFNLNQTLSGKLKSLDTLYLDNLGIESDFVKKYFNFFNMNKLVYLDISNNRLEYFPSAKYTQNMVISRLKWLNLRNNRLKEFNFDFIAGDSSFKIDMLDLGNNRLENISLIESYSKLLSLNHSIICLDNNNFDFTNVYHAFFSSILTAHYRIDLSYNQLDSESLVSVSTTAKHTRYLYLNLSHNNLVNFPLNKILTKGPNLQKVMAKQIDLSGNRITQLDIDSFETCYSLSYLNLSHNRLVTLSDKIFKDNGALKTLDLNNNMIECLPLSIFGSLAFLEFLNLSSNALIDTCLVPELFVGQTSLLDLDLSNNSIYFIHSRLFQNMHALRNLYIHSNPIKMLQEPTVGFSGIENIYISSFLLDPDQSTINLNKSITPCLIKNSPLSSYYKAVFVNYGLDIVLAYDDNDCDHILFLARNLILLNLKDEFALDKFLTECASFAESLFKPKDKIDSSGVLVYN